MNTNESVQGKFSIELKENALNQTSVQHPILKQIINEVIAEHAVDANLGSSFGEGGGG